jgi:hypothetical protein
MLRVLKAACLAAAAVVPLALANWLPRGIGPVAVVAYLLAMLWFGYAWLFAPSSGAAALRNAELDALFDGVFSDYEADLSRFPFRAHVFRRSGFYPVETLEMVYSYRTHSTDPDREIKFHRYFGKPGEGLVWQSCENADVRFFRRDDVPDTKAAFHLRGSQDSATHDVHAVLALPLRQMAPGRNGAASNKPIGVLCFDALSPEAADSLEQLFTQFHEGAQHDLVELTERASFYV